MRTLDMLSDQGSAAFQTAGRQVSSAVDAGVAAFLRSQTAAERADRGTAPLGAILLRVLAASIVLGIVMSTIIAIEAVLWVPELRPWG